MEKTPPRVLETKHDFDEFLYKDPYFAFLDILGFSTLVKKNTHAKLVDLYSNIFSDTVTRVDEMIATTRKKRAENEGKNYTDSDLRIINISDSILMWTAHGQPTALFEIVFAVSTLLRICILRGLPLRGCITRQPFSVFENGSVTSIVGRGLVHAYEEERIQQWSGCIVDGEIVNYFRSIEKVIRNWERPAPIERNEMVYGYNVPIWDASTKQMTTKSGYAVNWCHPVITEEMIASSFDQHDKKDERADSTTPMKVKNTIEFHRFCIEKRKQREEAIKRLMRWSEERP